MSVDEPVQQAREAWEAQDWARCGELYERLAIQAPDDPRVGDWWYDAALAHKFLRDWPEAYRLGRYAAAHAQRGTQDPAFWNLGIAATIRRDWPTARAAWEGFGIAVPPGEGPIDGDFGRACVRLHTAGGAEVVWVRRLCPTRGRVVNVPFDTSRRFGEVVVHDGEPKGRRTAGEASYPVFDELVPFEPSPLPTLSVTVTAAEPADIDALGDLFDAQGFGFEPLANGQMLCKCCSEGAVEQEAALLSGTQRCLVAAPPERAHEILDSWHRPTGRMWTDLHRAT